MPAHTRWSIRAVTSVKVAFTRQTFCRVRPGRDPGTRVHAIPNPFATSIPAAYSTTWVTSSDTYTASPPCAGWTPSPAPSTAMSFFFLAATPASLPFCQPAGRGCPGGETGETESDRRARSDSTPARKIAPSAQTFFRAQSPKHGTASRAAPRHHLPQPPSQPGKSPQKLTNKLDTAAPAGHPGTGHGAGLTHGQHTCRQQHRPVTTRTASPPKFRGNPTPQDPVTFLPMPAPTACSSSVKPASMPSLTR